MKAEVLAAIGETGLSRSAALSTALAANERVKYLLSLLQLGALHAGHPEQPANTLKHERLACGIDDPWFDDFTAAVRCRGDAYVMPGLDRVLSRTAQELKAMAAPVVEAGTPDMAARLEAMLAAMPCSAGNRLEAATLAEMSAASPPAGSDSLHRLVMDLHRQLNLLQASLAEETIDGATAYGLTDRDRACVAAFMAGVNRTAHLKFDHPGLGTTALGADGKLILQNDIGATDAHVVVIHVEGLTIRIAYTDVHEQRLQFFQAMLAPCGAVWETTQPGRIAGGTAFQLTSGRIDARDEAVLHEALRFIGSRLVFLIDWNRARKQLRAFLGAPERMALLQWATTEEIGHRAFLELGGARLVNQAIEAANSSAVHFGDRLCDVLGAAETETFLRFVLRSSLDCLKERRSPLLLRDRIRAELARHFSNERRRLLRVAAEHAALIAELAAMVHGAMTADGDPAAARQRAAALEHKADRLVAEVFEAVQRRPDHAAFGPLLHDADDAADELEEAMFLFGLLSAAGVPVVATEAMLGLATVLQEAAQAWQRALQHAMRTEERSAAEDADECLMAIDRIAVLEHAADDAERALIAAAVQQATGFRQLHLCTALGARLEAATDALRRASLLLRDSLLRKVLPG
ncbi:MAG TPA: hypothetical protein VGG99_17865 [Acetobacteraceae bacterium]|jgi:uncharacterized protein Yka (UPF0111/DUF47 family)